MFLETNEHPARERIPVTPWVRRRRALIGIPHSEFGIQNAGSWKLSSIRISNPALRVPLCAAAFRRAAVILAIVALPLRADELHLTGRGMIDGKVIEESSEAWRVETASGVLDVPGLIVARRIRGPALIEQYEIERGAEPLTVARHAALARWCLDHKLHGLALDHIRAAFEGDPLSEEARRLAGYVWLDGLWLKTANSPLDGYSDGGEGGSIIIEQLVNGWFRRISVIVDAFLTGADRRTRGFGAGRDQLLALRAPLAIPAACRLLGAGDAAVRLLLVEYLGLHRDDGATLNLLALTLVDDDAEVRLAAAGELGRRQDARALEILRHGLQCDLDEMVRRAAAALGAIKDRSAVPDLIKALPVNGTVPPAQTLASLFEEAIARFDEPTAVPLNDGVMAFPAAIFLPEFRRRLEAFAAAAPPPAGRHRSEVQEALISITGANFGFDAAAWSEWLRQNPPLQPMGGERDKP